MAAFGSRPSHSRVGSGLMAELLWALLNQSFAFILLKPVFLLLLGIKPVATPGTPLISLTFFPLLFYCRGPWFLEGKG